MLIIIILIEIIVKVDFTVIARRNPNVLFPL